MTFSLLFVSCDSLYGEPVFFMNHDVPYTIISLCDMLLCLHNNQCLFIHTDNNGPVPNMNVKVLAY